jgi:hypothetical protein
MRIKTCRAMMTLSTISAATATPIVATKAMRNGDCSDNGSPRRP